MPACVVDHVQKGMALYSEESFGPVAAVIRARDEEDAVRIANDSEYGLSAAVFSGDVSRALKVARRIRSGMCHINGPTVHDEAQMPFGGVNASGYGRFGGLAGVAEFTECVGSPLQLNRIIFRSDRQVQDLKAMASACIRKCPLPAGALLARCRRRNLRVPATAIALSGARVGGWGEANFAGVFSRPCHRRATMPSHSVRRGETAMYEHDDRPVGRLLSRRDAVKLLGAGSAAALSGIAHGSVGASFGPFSQAAGVIPSCVVKPEMTEGPYFVDTKLMRSDIRDGRSGHLLRLAVTIIDVTDGKCKALPNAIIDVWQCDAKGVYSGCSTTGHRDSTPSARHSCAGGSRRPTTAVSRRFTTIYPGWYAGQQ